MVPVLEHFTLKVPGILMCCILACHGSGHSPSTNPCSKLPAPRVKALAKAKNELHVTFLAMSQAIQWVANERGEGGGGEGAIVVTSFFPEK